MKKYEKPFMEMLAVQTTNMIAASLPLTDGQGDPDRQTAPGKKDFDWDEEEGSGW